MAIKESKTQFPKFPLRTSNANNQATLTSTGAEAELLSAKRKFQKVNQELVRQNVTLQEQLNRQRHEQNIILQENVRLKSRIVAQEARLQEGNDAVIELKRSIGERVEMLDAIGQHVLDLSRFLQVISLPSHDRPEQDHVHDESNDALVLEEMNQLNRQQARKQGRDALDLVAIKEEDSLAHDISTVSLKPKKPLRRAPK